MIYDGFIFFNELELLEIRLNELWDVVDKFILVEALVTFSGKPKRLYFQENRHLFGKFLDKITYVVAENMPTSNNPWDREIHQRNYIMRGLPKDVSPKDTLLVSDVDEIPRASAIRGVQTPPSGALSLQMHSYSVFVNAYNGEWIHAKVGSVREFQRLSPNEVRHSGRHPLDDAGWHFSSIGGPERIVEKFNSFSHQEQSVQKFNNLEEIRVKMKTGVGLFGGKMNFRKIDETFPKYLVDNVEKFKHLIGGLDAGY